MVYLTHENFNQQKISHLQLTQNIQYHDHTYFFKGCIWPWWSQGCIIVLCMITQDITLVSYSLYHMSLFTTWQGWVMTITCHPFVLLTTVPDTFLDTFWTTMFRFQKTSSLSYAHTSCAFNVLITIIPWWHVSCTLSCLYHSQTLWNYLQVSHPHGHMATCNKQILTSNVYVQGQWDMLINSSLLL